VDKVGKEKKKMGQKRRKRKKSQAATLTAWLLALVAIGSVCYLAMQIFMPNYESQNFRDYFELDPEELVVVVRDQRLQGAGVMSRNGEIYFSAEFVSEHFDNTIFWDDNTSKLTIVNGGRVLRMKAGESAYYYNDEPTDMEFPVEVSGGRCWLPRSLVTILYPVSVTVSQRENIAFVEFLEEERETSEIAASSASIRYKPDKKAIIEERLMQGDRVGVFAVEGDFTRVRTESGLLGYCLTRDLGEREKIAPQPKAPDPVYPERKPISGKVSMVWDQVFSREANTPPELLPGLDVISPTWLTFDIYALDGDLVDIGDQSYVDRAHSLGLQVWPLISDFSSNPDIALNSHITSKILSNTDMRDYVIKQLRALIDFSGLDGINVDFEYVQPADARHYIQFFRELYPQMRAKGKALSVDMYNPDLPGYWSQYYNRTEVGKNVDYLCVMAYDENSDSPEAGPNASISFVQEGLEKTMEEVPKEKVVLGLPFYSRIWEEVDDGGNISASNVARAMDDAIAFFESRNGEISWDEVLKNRYAEYSTMSNGKPVTYKAWLEDGRSLEAKLELAQRLEIAGVSGWKRGLESSGIWSLINNYMP
jgi:spore germination protein YaaH